MTEPVASGLAQRALRPQAPWLDAVERRSGLTPTGLTVVVGIVLAWFAAFAIGSRVLFLMVYGTAVLLIALIVSGRRRPPISAERSKIPVRVREGQPVAVALTVEGKGRLAALVVEETLDRLGTPVRLLIPSLAKGTSREHAYSFVPRLRGVYPVGPLLAIVGDPFGLTRRRHVLLGPEQLIVHPSTEQVHDRVLSREWEDPPVRPPISKPWPTGFEFYGMRDYVTGDDPRRIVWRASARTGRLLVRESEQGITDRVTLVIDTDIRTHSQGEPSDTFEVAVRAVASLARLHMRQGFVVSIRANAGPVANGLRGQRQIVQMLDAMARLTMGREPLVDALRRGMTDARRDAHVVVVSPLLDLTSAAVMKLLSDRGGSMAFVHVSADDEEDGSTHRAAAIGCEVVEIRPGASIEAHFRRATGAGIRR